MGFFAFPHVNVLGHDVVMVISTVNMTGIEIATLAKGNPVSFNFIDLAFSKDTGINLEA